MNTFTKTVLVPDPEAIAPPTLPQLVLVIHTASEKEGLHFSSMIINPKHKLLHVFDTLGGWSDDDAKKVLRGLYPELELFANYGYVVRNHTGKLMQQGSTCGPWALWTCAAYVFNFQQCRDPGSDDIDCSKLQTDAVAFWRTVTA
jgi:hypothetical protein